MIPLQANDKVKYIGRKFIKELEGLRGVVCGRVEYDPGKVTVDFGHAGAFILPEKVLRRW